MEFKKKTIYENNASDFRFYRQQQKKKRKHLRSKRIFNFSANLFHFVNN